MSDTSTVSAPLILPNAVAEQLAALRTMAAGAPVDLVALMRDIETPAGESRYRSKMASLTVRIAGASWPFFVTFSIETGHPVGTTRHMSMSVPNGRVPSPKGVWVVAEQLGFTGTIHDCRAWLEKLTDGGVAINVVQPVALHAAGAA